MHPAIQLLKACGAARRAGHEVVITSTGTVVTIGSERLRFARLGPNRALVEASRISAANEGLEAYSRRVTGLAPSVNAFAQLVDHALEGAVYA